MNLLLIILIIYIIRIGRIGLLIYVFYYLLLVTVRQHLLFKFYSVLQTCLPHAAVSQPCMSEFNKKHTQTITEEQTQRFRDSFILRIE